MKNFHSTNPSPRPHWLDSIIVKTTRRPLSAWALIALAAISFHAHDLRAQIIPIGEPATDIYYDRFLREALVADTMADIQSGGRGIFPLFRSMQSSDGAFILQAPFERSARAFVYITEDMRATRRSQALFHESVRGGLATSLGGGFFTLSSFRLDEELADDPSYFGKKWRGLAGDMESAALLYQRQNIALVFGRLRNEWGPLGSNLLISREAAPLDGLSLRYRSGKHFSFSYQFARLNSHSLDLDTMVYNTHDAALFVNRYLAMHRLEWRPSQFLHLGMFESILFAGPGRGLEMQYLNPLMFFHGNQLNEDNNDNTFLGFDWAVQPFDNGVFFGQILVDDIQVDHKSQGDEEPAEIGITTGIHIANLLPTSDAFFRWTRVTNRTYSQKLPRNQYVNQGAPIGHPFGNDFETIHLSVRRWFGSARWAGLAFDHTSRGEGYIAAPWAEPWLDVTGNYQEPFPTGVVERENKVTLSGRGLFERRVLLSFDAGWRGIHNSGHQLGQTSDGPFVRIAISLFASVDWRLR